jgi:hypothetical protein
MTTRRAAGRGSRVRGREPWTMPRGHRGRPTEMCLADDAVLTFSIRHTPEYSTHFSVSSCQHLWTFLPEGCGSGDGIASEEFDTEEFTDGHDLAATAAFTTDADVSAPKVAGGTPSLTEQAFLAG